MKKLMVFLCAMFLVFGMTGVAGATAVYLTDVTETTGFIDVEQASGSNYCWAATSSNMLEFTGWDGGFTNVTDIYGEYTSSWTNVNGNPYYGINWWFDGTNDKQGEAGWPQASPGFAYYNEALFNANNGYGESAVGNIPVMDWVESNVTADKPWAMLLGTDSGGIHWLTGYGYDDVLDGVWVTDSLDANYDLIWQSLTFDGTKWIMPDYNGWYVIAMDSLKRNSANVLPNVEEEPPNGVPEPATMLLLGTGLLGLALTGRRIRRS